MPDRRLPEVRGTEHRRPRDQHRQLLSHKAWADALGLKHTLLADFNREVVKKYGLYFEPLNCGQRATVIVDKNGKVAYVKVQEIKVARDDKDILEALKKLH